MTHAKKVLFEGESEFGHYRVVDMIYDGRQARMLFGDNNSPQSGEAQDGDPTLLFSYNQRFLEIAKSCQPKRVLVIGGGAFSLPMALLEYFHDVSVDVVELDPLLVELARRFFTLKNDARLQITTGDGRRYIETCQSSYDLIITDAFSEFDVPESLLNGEAIQHYHRLLAADGMVAINFVADYHTARTSLAHKLFDAFSREFPAVEIYPIEFDGEHIGEQNLLLVASKQINPSLDYLQATPITLPTD